MNSTIAKAFALDTEKDLRGVWFPGPLGLQLKVAAEGNENFKKYMREHHEATRMLIQANLASDNDVGQAVLEAMAHTILLDWKGNLDDAGKEIPYSPDLGVEMMTVHRRLRDYVSECSRNAEKFRLQERTETEKNS